MSHFSKVLVVHGAASCAIVIGIKVRCSDYVGFVFLQ
jgi:hypothetical protein